MNSSIKYTDFDRISDTIMFLGNGYMLDFCTRLSGKNKSGERRFYEFESQYQSNQFIGVDIGRSIKRNMNFYYLISNKDSFGSGIILRTGDVYILQNIMTNSLLPLYFGNSRIYKEKDNSLVIVGDYKPVEYIKDLQSWIRFEPTVIEYEDGKFKEGARVFVSYEDEYFDLTIDRLLEFYGYMNYQNMYLQAEAQCNYAKMAPYLENNIVISGGLGSGNGERAAENLYNNNIQQQTNYNRKNNFLENAKKKEE